MQEGGSEGGRRAQEGAAVGRPRRAPRALTTPPTPLRPGSPAPAVLHLIAMARSCGLDLGLDDFQRVSDRVPFIADLKPSGKYVMEDVHKVCGGRPGGWPGV